MDVLAPPATSSSDLTSTRDAILDAAERRFAEHGFAGVSVREISSDAGLKNQASLYYHFPGKQQIYEAALKRGVDAIIERLSEGRGEPTPSGTSVVARELDRVLDYLVDHPHLARLIQRAGLDDSAFVQGVVRPIVEPLYLLGVQALRQTAGPWDDADVPHVVAGLYHLIFGYFADAPLLEAVLGTELRSPAAIARQRRFLRTAVAQLLGTPSNGYGGNA